MGQYYLAIILGNQPDMDEQEQEVIRYVLSPFGCGSKLMEHSYLDNGFVFKFEQFIGKSGMFYKSRIVWAGDYADKESNDKNNLYKTAEQIIKTIPHITFTENIIYYRYIVNHTKKQYVDKEHLSSEIHPLPLLVCEGNKRGGGDYWGKNSDLCGTWARDIISVETSKPSDKYSELVCNFSEE
jgi:hypothetical protein